MLKLGAVIAGRRHTNRRRGSFCAEWRGGCVVIAGDLAQPGFDVIDLCSIAALE